MHKHHGSYHSFHFCGKFLCKRDLLFWDSAIGSSNWKALDDFFQVVGPKMPCSDFTPWQKPFHRRLEIMMPIHWWLKITSVSTKTVCPARILEWRQWQLFQAALYHAVCATPRYMANLVLRVHQSLHTFLSAGSHPDFNELGNLTVLASWWPFFCKLSDSQGVSVFG